tara:strand:+ start:11268 stop:12014 length:747 start_codon:yes stop_codon:yes gene_type:complete
MDNICLIINTNTSVADVWPMFFGELETQFPKNIKKYIFVNNTDYEFGEDYNVIFYDNNKQYRDQLIECFPNIKEKYCLYIQEDYILYDNVQWDKICNIIKLMEFEKNIDFVKLMRGTDIIEKIPNTISHELPLHYIIDSECYYTQGVTLWNVDKLKLIFNKTPNSHIGGSGNHVHFEVIANIACKKYCGGILYYNDEPKRGMHHYDSSIVPYIASAIVKGKWNISEYPTELPPLLQKYNININKRGSC